MERVRQAESRDAEPVQRLYLAMMREMVAGGDDALADDATAVEVVDRRVTQALRDADRLLLVAESSERGAGPLGMLEAAVTGLHAVYAPKRVLHIHAVFVAPGERRRGVGRALLEAALAWGQQQRCVEADLGVLEGNPARRLYEQLGFVTFRRQLRLRL